MESIPKKQQKALGLPSPQEAIIRSANADRIARRKAAASLAGSLAETSGESLDRRNTPRQVGGTFEALQEVPRRKAPKNFNLTQADLESFLRSFNFGAQTSIVRDSSYLPPSR